MHMHEKPLPVEKERESRRERGGEGGRRER